MINWTIIPMVYNDSFTYMEWLGKLTYIADNHEGRINDCEKNIVDLWAKVNDHESRIGELENWRTDVVDPFIEATTETLADHERRIAAAEDDIDVLQGWREDTVDPFITTINSWKTGTVDPFIQATDTWIDEVAEPFMDFITDWRTGTIDPFVTSTTETLTRLGTDATAESSARRNADNELSERISALNAITNETKTKVNRLEIQAQNVGTVRYFMDTATISSDGQGGTNLTVVLPDEDWVTCDIRFLAGGAEYRVTGTISDTTLVSTADNGKSFSFTYNSSTKTVTINVSSTVWSVSDIKRFDYILYSGALTQAAQDQADVDFFNAMDSNGDGYVDARDASLVLSFYTDASRGIIPSQYSGKEAWAWWATNVGNCDPDAFPDFDGDGKVSAIDASSLLGYYSFAATNPAQGTTGPELMKMYRTEYEERRNS